MMIVRMWRGRARAENADAYERFVTTKVFAELPAIAGHRGAYLLKRTIGDEVEFVAVTLWESLASIRSFAGDAIERAVVEPEARTVLSSFDDFVRHFELAHAAPCA
ncbi:MAG: antibiotic biosynthesis monooxygenase [Rhodospirillum sp.]|nr:antibiotic biosynthesis monooxygenase [Rhodospirillum sp.]